MRLAVVLGVVVATLAGASPAHAQSDRPAVFVGPLTRGAFVDMDAGIRDSIRDIKEQARTAGFKLATSERDATLILVVLGRGVVTAGSVGFSSATVNAGTGSGLGFVVPNEKPTLSTLLRVAAYERGMQSEGGTWTAAAKAVVEDLGAWWDANAAAVRGLPAAQSK